MAVALRDVGQSDADIGRQPASGLVANNDFSDLEPRQRTDRGSCARRNGVRPAEQQADNWIARKGGKDGCRGGQAQVFTRVYESLGQSRGVPSPKERGTGRSAGDRIEQCTEARVGRSDATVPISNHRRGARISPARRYRPALRGAPSETSY